MKKESEKCYCCKSAGVVRLPVGVSSVFYLCKGCFKSYKKAQKIIFENHVKMLDK